MLFIQNYFKNSGQKKRFRGCGGETWKDFASDFWSLMKNDQIPIMKNCHIPDFKNQNLLDALVAPMSGESFIVKYP